MTTAIPTPAQTWGERSHRRGPEGEQTGGDRDEQHHDQQLVVEPEPDEDTGDPPPSGPVPRHRADRAQHHARPQQQVDGGGQQHVAERQGERAEGEAPGRQSLREPSAAHFAGELGDHQHRQAGSDEGRDPERPDLVDDLRRAPRQQGGQRRLVEMAPVRSEHAEVELVAVVAVARDRQRQHHGERRHRGQDRCASERGAAHRDPPPGCRRTDRRRPSVPPRLSQGCRPAVPSASPWR